MTFFQHIIFEILQCQTISDKSTAYRTEEIKMLFFLITDSNQLESVDQCAIQFLESNGIQAAGKEITVMAHT